MRRIRPARVSFFECGGASKKRSGGTSGSPGFVISIRSEKISTSGATPVIEKS